jgi:hypothetical protein
MLLRQMAAIALLAVLIAGCESPNPNASTATSGHLILFVDELYGAEIRALADTFMLRSPNAKIEIRTAPARMALQGLLDMETRRGPVSDTSASVSAIIGRKLLPDEQKVITNGELNTKEYVIGYDGIALVAPASMSLSATTREQLIRALTSPAPVASMLDSTAGSQPLHFLFPDQYSSTYWVARRLLLNDQNPAAPAHYFSTGDSVLDRVAAGDGIGIISWTRAHHDSARLHDLSLGHTDSTSLFHPPVHVSTQSLVTGAYSLKQPVVGYTFGLPNSLAVGFLAWLARSEDAQYYLARHNIQPENVKIRLVVPDSEGGAQ